MYKSKIALRPLEQMTNKVSKLRFIPSAQIAAILLLAVVFLSSCNSEKYPKYSLETIEYVPDSLKSEQRKFITETVRAASQHMTGGDYEDVDETIQQAERTSGNIFSVKVIGLKKELYENEWSPLKIKPQDFTSEEKRIFDSLSNYR